MVVFRMHLIADLEPTKQVVPLIASLDHPSARSVVRVLLSRRFFLDARLDVGNVPAPRGRMTPFRIIISFVTTQRLARAFLSRRPSDHQGIKRGIEWFHVVAIRAGKCDCQRNPAGIRELMPLGAQFPSIGRVFSGLVPPFTGADTVALSMDWNLPSMPLRSS